MSMKLYNGMIYRNADIAAVADLMQKVVAFTLKDITEVAITRVSAHWHYDMNQRSDSGTEQQNASGWHEYLSNNKKFDEVMKQSRIKARLFQSGNSVLIHFYGDYASAMRQVLESQGFEDYSTDCLSGMSEDLGHEQREGRIARWHKAWVEDESGDCVIIPLVLDEHISEIRAGILSQGPMDLSHVGEVVD